MGVTTAFQQPASAVAVGKLVPKDCVQAMKCYELGLQDPEQIGCANPAPRRAMASALDLSGSITPSSPSL